MSDEEMHLPENLHKLAEEYFDQSFGRRSNFSQNLIEERNSREKIRRESDRYTLEEAAFFVGSRVNALPESILKKLIKAVGDGSLIVYAPGSNERYEPDHAYVQGCYEEAYGADLNNWFEKNESRIGRLFPDPDAPIKTNTKARSKGEAPETRNWKMLVQAEATRRWRTLRKGGANPTRLGIANELPKWCRDNDVKTKTEGNPTANYIYRFALSKKYWTPPDESENSEK